MRWRTKRNDWRRLYGAVVICSPQQYALTNGYSRGACFRWWNGDSGSKRHCSVVGFERTIDAVAWEARTAIDNDVCALHRRQSEGRNHWHRELASDEDGQDPDDAGIAEIYPAFDALCSGERKGLALTGQKWWGVKDSNLGPTD